MSQASSSTASLRPSAAGHRLWLLTTIGLLAAAGIVIIHFQAEMERNFKNWLTSAVIAVALLLVVLWFLFFSRLRWTIRLGVLALLLAAGFSVPKALRLDGTVDGTGLPKLAWRWSAPRTVHFEPAPLTTALPARPGAALPAGSADVPQFFGPHRDGVVTNAHLARDWQATPPRQLWRQPAGAAWSAFAVAGGRAYTQEQRGEEECVTCYELLTGHLLWSQGHPVHFSQWQGGDGPRATPSIDHGQIFAIGATGLLDCLDAATGRRIWTRDVLAEHQLENLIWGVSASPLVFDDTVVVTGGLTKGPTVLAYRRSTGEPLWHSGADKASYASPLLATLAGRRVILSFNAASLTAHDPATGEVLLSQPWSDDKWPKAAQPVVLPGDRVFVSAGYGAGCTLLQIQGTPQGKLSATQLWKSMRMKTQFNSAAVRDGYLYGLDDGMLACVDVATGERKWKGGRFGSGQTLLVDDLVLIQSEPGAVVLAEAKPEAYQELSRLPALNAKTWNHPTLAGRYLLVRNSEEMACYELPLQPSTTQTAAR